MRWSDIPTKPTENKLRQFTGLWLGLVSIAAGWQGWHHGRWTLACMLGVLAVTIGGVGLARPGLVRPVFVGLMFITFPIGWVISHLMLACLFYGVFAPLGLVFRAMGRDPLVLRKCNRDSYWIQRSLVLDTRRYFRQF